MTDGRIRFSDLWENFEAWILSGDSRLYRTLGRLTANPGRVAREYIEGKRVSYYKPISYFLILSALYVAIRNLIGFDPIENWNSVFGTTPQSSDPAQEMSMRAGIWLREHMDKMLIFLALTFAGVAKLFFWRSRYFYAEYISLALYVVGHFLLFSLVAMLMAVWIDPRLFFLTYAIQLLYFPYALATFHEGNAIWLFAKGFLTALISYFVYVFLAFTAVIFVMNIFDNLAG